MAKRKGGAIVADVDESKKVKQDPPSKKSTEGKPQEPAVASGSAEGPGSNDLDYSQIIITGPIGCGKSCLVLAFMGQLFPPSRAPFLSKQYLHMRENKQPVMIWDLDSRKEYEAYRMRSYPEADFAFLCFDVKKQENDERPLSAILSEWYVELKRHCGMIPIFLVGLKEDLRNSDGRFFSAQEIEAVKDKYPNIREYKRVSAYMDKSSVHDLFTQAINSITTPKPKRMFATGGFEIIARRWLV